MQTSGYWAVSASLQSLDLRNSGGTVKNQALNRNPSTNRVLPSVPVPPIALDFLRASFSPHCHAKALWPTTEKIEDGQSTRLEGRYGLDSLAALRILKLRDAAERHHSLPAAPRERRRFACHSFVPVRECEFGYIFHTEDRKCNRYIITCIDLLFCCCDAYNGQTTQDPKTVNCNPLTLP